ncbi:MAG: hypothetical protein JEZ02_11050 [Desulfatibacillum sp.]|nr:hypothetical protein [Desulfatibacillum sp.]
MKPPIIINESGDITFFSSVEEAEEYLEAIDVTNGVYQGYDAEGHPLKLQALNDRVTIEKEPGVQNRVFELEKLIRTALANVGRSCDHVLLGDIESLVKEAELFAELPPCSCKEMLFSIFKESFADMMNWIKKAKH